MKLCTIVGARPQFIKAAALSRALRQSYQEILVHTGQHYDANMSDIFFEELSIPKPDYNLGISGGTHGKMTGKMLGAIEEVLMEEKPRMLLVYGDTNSTLAGALAAVKLHIPVCHVEAGVRMRTMQNPEEINRLLTDHISSLLCCSTYTAVDNLKMEGITQGVYDTGDLMYDAVLYYGKYLQSPQIGELISLEGEPLALPEHYYLLTCHREENTGDAPLLEILSAMQLLDAPVIYPVHPRNRERAKRLVSANRFNRVILVNPVGYLTSLYLVKNAVKVVTDSGGLQREAWFYDVPCVTLLENPIWPETFGGNMNQICPPHKEAILHKLSIAPDFFAKGTPFGEGHAAEKIVEIITAYMDAG